MFRIGDALLIIRLSLSLSDNLLGKIGNAIKLESFSSHL